MGMKLICKLLIYAGGALKFSVQSPNYVGVLDEIVHFFQLGCQFESVNLSAQSL